MAKQTRKVMSDDDSISLNSSDSENYDLDQEFLVDRILAEKNQRNKTFYLISWDGYALEKSTWEPRENIQDDAIISSWMHTQAKEARGEQKPFNVAKFQAQIAKLEKEKAERHRRRKIKRRRVGLPVSDSEPGSADDSDFHEEAIAVDSDQEDGEKKLSSLLSQKVAKLIQSSTPEDDIVILDEESEVNSRPITRMERKTGSKTDEAGFSEGSLVEDQPEGQKRAEEERQMEGSTEGISEIRGRGIAPKSKEVCYSWIIS